MLKITKDILHKALKSGADEAEVFALSSRSTSVEITDQKIESIDIKDESGIGLRIFKDSRLGFAFTTEMQDESLDGLIKRAIDNSAFSESDPFNKLPQPSSKTPKLLLYSKPIKELPIEKKIELAKEIEAAARSFDARVRKTEKSVYFDEESEIEILNSNGVELASKQNICGGFIEVIAEDKGQMENGAYSKYVRALDKLDPKEIGKTAALRAVELLGARAIASGKLDLVMDPTVAEHFLMALSPLFSADFIQKNKSALKGRIGSQIASPILTVVDDGSMKDGVASSPFDTEGTPTQETILVNSGVLKSFLHNNYTALKDGVRSTGNGGRGSFKGIPTVGPTNFHIKPGEISPQEMIRGVKKGLYITRVMGMHTVNPISGDFSVGAAGIMIENGKKTFPVRSITIAGNLIELLKNISAVGSDLKPASSIVSPTLLISGITVSGN